MSVHVSCRCEGEGWRAFVCVSDPRTSDLGSFGLVLDHGKLNFFILVRYVSLENNEKISCPLVSFNLLHNRKVPSLMKNL